jgi:hypothetical protein
VFATDTHFAYGKMNIMAVIKVISTNTMSIAASMLFCNPNCSGVKAKLNTKFNKKGKSTQKDILPLKKRNATYPKEIAIATYNTVQTGPKSQLGGAHEGFIKV